mmetsp:Transcript_13254/g.30155  ORF Transcript_13254/g.30155 Transcript_13254/m.30155 type:complete len:237 (-) Transcript_13254:84-794(-)
MREAHQTAMDSEYQSLNPPVGMPAPDVSAKRSSCLQFTILLGVSTVMSALGLGIAALVYFFGAKDKYDKRLSGIVENEFFWAFLGGWLIQRMVVFVNFYPAGIKGVILPIGPGAGGQMRQNPFLYTQMSAEQKPTGPIIGMYADGDIGVYNRANRSLQHMIENAPGWLVNFCAASCVFPFPCLITAAVIAVGRILHQVGYTKGYGTHAPGFMLSVFGAEAMSGMALLVFLKGIKVL